MYTRTHARAHTHTRARARTHTRARARARARTHARDLPVPVTDWPHPARRVPIMETSDLISYATQIYTDGSKIGGKVGVGVAIYMDKRLVRKCKYKLQDCCSNNQAEQIVKS